VLGATAAIGDTAQRNRAITLYTDIMKNTAARRGVVPGTQGDSDLGDKIEYLLKNDRYKEYGAAAKSAYENRHTPEHCFESYYSQIMEYAKS
jgi:hypothetical protein